MRSSSAYTLDCAKHTDYWQKREFKSAQPILRRPADLNPDSITRNENAHAANRAFQPVQFGQPLLGLLVLLRPPSVAFPKPFAVTNPLCKSRRTAAPIKVIIVA